MELQRLADTQLGRQALELDSDALAHLPGIAVRVQAEYPDAATVDGAQADHVAEVFPRPASG